MNVIQIPKPVLRIVPRNKTDNLSVSSTQSTDSQLNEMERPSNPMIKNFENPTGSMNNDLLTFFDSLL